MNWNKWLSTMLPDLDYDRSDNGSLSEYVLELFQLVLEFFSKYKTLKLSLIAHLIL